MIRLLNTSYYRVNQSWIPYVDCWRDYYIYLYLWNLIDVDVRKSIPIPEPPLAVW